jgi:hypothetical protein
MGTDRRGVFAMIMRARSALSRSLVLAAVLAALTLVALAPPAQAQQPSPNAIALAKEIITLKGSAGGYNGVVPSVIERAKQVFLQTNFNLSKDLNEVAAKLRTDYASRAADPLNDAAKLYASRFTEQELREVATFYKTSVGKKVIAEEAQLFERSMSELDTWAGKFSEEVISKMRAEMKKRGHDL